MFTGVIGSLLLNEFHWSTIFYSFGALSFIWAICLRTYARRMQRLKKVKDSSANLMEANIPEKDENTEQKKKHFPVCQLCNKVPFW